MRERRYQAQATEQSPDSVILTLESNFISLFSSASASVDRCSFASDAASSSSDISPQEQLGGGGGQEGGNSSYISSQENYSWSGPDHPSHPNKSLVSSVDNRPRPSTKGQKAKALQENGTINSFSLALKECQKRRSTSDRRRQASLDVSNVTAVVSSVAAPASVKKLGGSVVSRRSSGNFPSQVTPTHHHHRDMAAATKGWSSERAPPPSTTSNTVTDNGNNGFNRRRRIHGYVPSSGSSYNNNNNNGRALPSKWEDAERWIFSPVNNPVSGPVPGPSGIRKPKSKSGPLGAPGFAYYSLYSPAGGGSLPVYETGLVAGPSPFSAGVLGVGRGEGGGNGVGSNGFNHHVVFQARNEPCIARSVSIHGCSEMVALQSFNSQDEKLDGFNDAATDISRAVSRRDMATQMSPEGSVHSSPSGRLSFSVATHSALPIVELELQSIHSSRADVRDVQVDERVTVTRWSKRRKGRNHKKSLEIVEDWRKKTSDASSSAWNVSVTAKSISKATREEAKINAWENLQKAKAEAAIRKLEMKLEKKRSSSMDKIMNKLRSAQKKAQEMRSAVIASHTHQVSRTSHTAVSSHRTRQMGYLSGCFTCHAF